MSAQQRDVLLRPNDHQPVTIAVVRRESVHLPISPPGSVTTATLYEISTDTLRVHVTDLGATVTRVEVRGSVADAWKDIAIGFDRLSCYVPPSAAAFEYFGPTVGRYANRIGGGIFYTAKQDGSTQRHELAKNDNGTCSHGGVHGFHVRVWDSVRVYCEDSMAGLEFVRVSPDGEEGFPGTVEVRATYAIGTALSSSSAKTSTVSSTAVGDVVMRFQCKHLMPPEPQQGDPGAVPCSIVNHVYWNLDGLQPQSPQHHDVKDNEDDRCLTEVTKHHRLWLRAPLYTVADSLLVPTGAIAPVKGTPLDFFTPDGCPVPLGKAIEELTETPFHGFDHNFVLQHPHPLAREVRGHSFYPWCVTSCDASDWTAAVLSSDTSRLRAAVFTTFPGLQLYSGNFLPSKESGDDAGGLPNTYHDRRVVYRSGVCLEAQYFPDSPNHSHFPSTAIEAGTSRTDWQIYAFSFES